MRVLPTLVAVLASLCLCASFTACGGGAKREKVEFAAITGVSGQNDAGIKAVATSTRERARDLYITVTITNSSAKTVSFRNAESLRVAGFKVAADGREAQGAEAGKIAKTTATRLHDLAPGAETELKLNWVFEPPLEHATYPWTLTLSNMYYGDDKLGDVTLSYAPAAK